MELSGQLLWQCFPWGHVLSHDLISCGMIHTKLGSKLLSVIKKELFEKVLLEKFLFHLTHLKHKEIFPIIL